MANDIEWLIPDPKAFNEFNEPIAQAEREICRAFELTAEVLGTSSQGSRAPYGSEKTVSSVLPLGENVQKNAIDSTTDATSSGHTLSASPLTVR